MERQHVKGKSEAPVTMTGVSLTAGTNTDPYEHPHIFIVFYWYNL